MAAMQRTHSLRVGSSSKEKKSSCIVVGIRCRPLNEKEKERGEHCIWRCASPMIEEFDSEGNSKGTISYEFDHVFNMSSSTTNVFLKQCVDILQGCLEGYNGTVFAYGQTSSGKTYTLMGDPVKAPGVTFQGISYVFDHIAKHPHVEWQVYISYIEIYNESITDLLQEDPAKGKNMKIVEDKVYGVVVKDVTEVQAMSVAHCHKTLALGESRRTFSSTEMNSHSSRSHTIFRIRIESAAVGKESEDEALLKMKQTADEMMQTKAAIQADQVSLYVVDWKQRRLHIQAGELHLILPLGEGIAGSVASTGKAIIVADAYEDPRFSTEIDKKTGYRTKAVLCMPVRFEDKVVGVVQYLNKVAGATSECFVEDDIELVTQLVERIAAPLARALQCARTVTMSVLNLVDLAGSERASKTRASGVALVEGANINKSLLNLGVIIEKLSEGGQRDGNHAPFRNSKLTQLLRTSLGGNTRTCLIAAISPAESNRSETISTLQFASRAKNIVNKASKNERVDPMQLVSAYEAEIKRLKEQIQGMIIPSPHSALGMDSTRSFNGEHSSNLLDWPQQSEQYARTWARHRYYLEEVACRLGHDVRVDKSLVAVIFSRWRRTVQMMAEFWSGERTHELSMSPLNSMTAVSDLSEVGYSLAACEDRRKAFGDKFTQLQVSCVEAEAIICRLSDRSSPDVKLLAIVGVNPHDLRHPHLLVSATLGDDAVPSEWMSEEELRARLAWLRHYEAGAVFALDTSNIWRACSVRSTLAHTIDGADCPWPPRGAGRMCSLSCPKLLDGSFSCPHTQEPQLRRDNSTSELTSSTSAGEGRDSMVLPADAEVFSSFADAARALDDLLDSFR